MSIRLRDRRRAWLLATIVVATAIVTGGRGYAAGDSPVGRIVAAVIPVNNRIHSPQQILDLLQTKPGKPYDDSVALEDTRRLHATKWFVPGGAQLQPRIEPDGRVTVFVFVTELTSTVLELQFRGAQHLSPDKLRTLVGVRKGDPMSPLTNELGRQAILREYQELGRIYTRVELVDGTKPTDTRVVYEIVEAPVLKVAGIEIMGNVKGLSGRLRSQLVTGTEYFGFIGGKFNRASIDADMKKLHDYYYGLGYLAVKIGYDLVPSLDSSHVTIVYHIDEGMQYQVESREIVGTRAFPPEILEGRVTLQPGNPYDQRTVQGDVKRLQDYMGYRGHQVTVNENITEVPDEPGLVRVAYQVNGDRGEPDRVGQVTIEGNTITQERVIRNQLGLYPGQVLPYPMKQTAEQRLARLGIFDTTTPPEVVIMPNPLDGFKDVIVRVNETRTGQFMIGAGINSNAGLNGSIVINERNFDLFRFPTSWDDFRSGQAFRGNGQEFQLSAQPGTQYSRYSATFREPYLFDTLFGFQDSLYFFQRQYNEYLEERIGDKVTISRMLDPLWRASLSVRAEAVEVKNPPSYAGPGITDYVGWHALYGARIGLTRDSRDSVLFPTSGSVFDIGVEQEFGDYAFPVATAEYTKLFSSNMAPFAREDGSGKHVLAFRTQLSVEGGNAPIYERFFAGGFRSIRGFTFDGVGPSQNDLMTRGTFMFLNSLEYQIPILQNDKLHFVTFVDSGTVESSVEIRNYRVSAGFGFRISVPALGPQPIALDFAFPIVKTATDNTQVFSFYVGMFGL